MSELFSNRLTRSLAVLETASKCSFTACKLCFFVNFYLPRNHVRNFGCTSGVSAHV